MTATPAAPAPQAGQTRTLHLSELLRRPITDRGGESIGRLSDVIVRLRGADNPLVTGLVASVGGRELYVPIEQASSLSSDEVKLTSAKLDLRQFERREGEVLLRADVLGHRLIDVESAQLIKAGDLELVRRGEDWVVAGVDTHRQSRWLFGSRHAEPSEHSFREWAKFEPLIGHTGSALLRGPFARIRRLKPAQIADLIENASKEEETEILGQVHADPELEADVFEELDEDLAIRLLGARTDAEIAEVLTRMRADDAADAIAELPQRRRQPVLDLLPQGQRTKVLTLMGFNPTSAQAAPQTPMREIYDDDPVRVGADTDVVDVAVLMSDYNLITIPVVDERRKMIGVITVDDVLEVTLPDDWRRREAAQPPDAHHGDSP